MHAALGGSPGGNGGCTAETVVEASVVALAANLVGGGCCGAVSVSARVGSVAEAAMAETAMFEEEMAAATRLPSIPAEPTLNTF